MTQRLSALFLVGVFGLVLTSKSTLAQGTFNAINDGSWDSPATWTCISGTCGPGYPTNPGDVVNIAFYAVTVVGNINVSSLEIGSGGILDLRDFTGHTFGSLIGNNAAVLRITTTSGTAPFPTITTDNYTNLGGSIVEFYGTANYNIPARQYPTLSITGTNTKTFATGSVQVVGDLNVEIGAILNLGSANITVSQTTTVRGALIDDISGGSNQFQAEFNVFPGGSFKDGAGAAISNSYIFFGTVTVLGEFSAVANSANTSIFEFRNVINTFPGSTFNLANNGQYRFVSGSLISISAEEPMTFGLNGEGGPCVVSANVLVNTSGTGGVITFNLGSSNFIINSGFSFSNNNGSLGITLNGVAPAQLTGAGTWIQNDNAILNYQLANQISANVDFSSSIPNTVNYGSSVNQNILGTTYHHVTFNNAGTKILKGNVITNGDLRILGSAILNTDDGGQQRNISISGNLERGSSAVFNQGSGRVTLNSTFQQSITGGFTFYKLVVTPNSRVLLNPTTPIVVQDSLALVSGRIQIGDNNLTYQGIEANLARSTGWIHTDGTGNFVRTGTPAAANNFYVGDASNMRSVAMGNFTNPTSVRFSTPNPVFPTGASSVGAGMWVVSTGTVTTNITFNNVGGSANASSPIMVSTSLSPNWNPIPTNGSGAPNFSTTTPVVFAGTPIRFAVFAPPTTYFSRAGGGIYNDIATTWATTSGGPACNCSPVGIPNATAIITSVVTMNNVADVTNGVTIDIQSGGVLSMTVKPTNAIANLQGTTGGGTLRIRTGATDLPAVTTNNFVTNNTNTIDFNSVTANMSLDATSGFLATAPFNLPNVVLTGGSNFALVGTGTPSYRVNGILTVNNTTNLSLTGVDLRLNGTTSNHIVAGTLSLADAAATLNVGTGATLQINAAATLSQVNSSAVTVNGTIINLGTHTNLGVLNIPGAGVYNNQNNVDCSGTGSQVSIFGNFNNQAGGTLNAGVLSVNKIVQSGGFYNHQRDGGTLPNLTWATGSNCQITGIVNTSVTGFANQTFGNFIWNCPSQAVVQNIGVSNSIAGNLVITSGTMTFGNTRRAISVGGNLSGAGTIDMSNATALDHILILNGANSSIGNFVTGTNAQATVRYAGAIPQQVFQSSNYKKLVLIGSTKNMSATSIVSTSLSLSNCKLVLGTGADLQLNFSEPRFLSLVNNVNSYIETSATSGSLIWNNLTTGANVFNFPVGTATAGSTPLRMGYNGSPVSGAHSVKALPATTFTPFAPTANVNTIWEVNKPTGGTTPAMTFDWRSPGNVTGTLTTNTTLVQSASPYTTWNKSLVTGILNNIVVTNGGTSYTSPPAVTIAGGGGSGASATAFLSGSGVALGTIGMLVGGSGYSASPTVIIVGFGGSGTGATATANVTGGVINNISITGSGIGYIHPIQILIEDPTGSDAVPNNAAITVNPTTVNQVILTNTGTGFTTAPTINFTGGGGTGATATANLTSGTGEVRIGGITNTSLGAVPFVGGSPLRFGILSEPPPPAFPLSLTASATGATSIQLNWTDNSTTETGFKVQRSLTTGVGFSDLTTLPANSTTYIDNTATPSITYFYRIIAANNTGESAPSNEASAATAITSPVLLSVSITTGGGLLVSWQNNSLGVDRFEIERALDTSVGSAFTKIGEVGGTVNSFTDRTAPPTRTAFYRVRAGASNAFSTYSNILGAVAAETVTFLNAPLEQSTVIYPNPSSTGIFSLTTPADFQPIEGQVYNLQGQWIGNFPIQNASIDLSQLPAGSYQLQLKDATQKQVNKRVVKE